MTIVHRHGHPVLVLAPAHGAKTFVRLDAPRPDVASRTLPENASFDAVVHAMVQDGRARVLGFDGTGSPVIEPSDEPAGPGVA